MLLTHVGFEVPFINWVMICISSTSFAVLINGSASHFFREGRGLRKGCPLSPLLFLLVAEGLRQSLAHEKSHGLFQGIQISPTLYLSHLIFVDDVLILCDGHRGDVGGTTKFNESIL
jgi:hypothetical protein